MKIILTAALAISILSACATNPQIPRDQAGDRTMTCAEIEKEMSRIADERDDLPEWKEPSPVLMLLPVVNIFFLTQTDPKMEYAGRTHKLASMFSNKGCYFTRAPQ